MKIAEKHSYHKKAKSLSNSDKVFLLRFSLIGVLIVVSVLTSLYYFEQGHLIAYGDAESHLNISKRVVHSITPGLAQLGGIWLPLPHLLMIPFVSIDYLWRTGFAGAIVSGVLFVVGGYYIYKLSFLLTNNHFAGLVAAFVYASNPNVLYLQSTAMTEIPLIAFFILSIYFFVDYLRDDHRVMSLVFAAFFALAASLSRYDGWVLVIVEAGILVLYYLQKLINKHFNIKNKTSLKRIVEDNLRLKMEAMFLLFCTLSMVGIIGWLIWDYLILKDPFYFTNSPFSAKSQQKGWQAKGELPSYGNIISAVKYYSYTSYLNIGKLITLPALGGFFLYLFDRKIGLRVFMTILLSVPFIFYVITLYLGQSVIFVPQLTPESFTWNLFNVRYGVMMIPAAALFVSYLFYRIINASSRSKITLTRYGMPVFFIFITWILFLQPISFMLGKETAITVDDGVFGLSSASETDAQQWLKDNYNAGLILMDDYARTVSVIKSGIPMESVIYIGNKPYWEESLDAPEKHAEWIVMQANDSVWINILENKEKEDRLYKYFEKVYTSPEVLIFKRNTTDSLTNNIY